MIERLTQLVFRGRYLVWMAVLVMIVAAWGLVPPVAFDQSIEGFFPPDHPALQVYRRSEEIFGGEQLILVAYDDADLWSEAGLDRVRTLAGRIARDVPGVARVDALDQMPVPWRVDRAVEAAARKEANLGNVLRMAAGRTTVRSLIESLGNGAADAGERAQIRDRLCAHPLFNGLLVNSAGTATAVIVRLNPAERAEQRAVVTALRRVADAFAIEQRLGRAAVAGSPVLVADGFASLERDNQTLGLVAMALMAITMFVAVRNPAWALLSLVAGWATWELTRIFLTVFELKLSLSAGPIIAQTIVLCMPAASHLAIRFFANVREGLSREQAAHVTLAAMFAPVALCSVASASGYLATWLASTVKPVAQLGMTMFACNLTAGTLVWLLSAGAMTVHWRPPARSGRGPEHRQSAVAQGVGRLTAWVLVQPGKTLALFVLPVILATAGIFQIALESNYINIHRPESRVARDYRFVEDRMGGIGLVEVVFPAPAEVTPGWLDRLAGAAVQFRDEDPGVIAGTMSLADLLAAPVHVDEELRRRIVELKIETLEQPRYARLLANLWNRGTGDGPGMARMLVRIREDTPPDLKEACFARLIAAARRDLSPDAQITGSSHLMTQVTHAVVGTAFNASVWSAVMSLTVLWLALRHLRLALLAFAPTLLAVGLVLGLMGWLGLKVDMSTALVAGVAIGLSIDDAVHCLLRWKQETRAGRTAAESLRIAYAGAGPGVVLSSSAVSLGFLAMLFSEFAPMSTFGWLVAVATAGGSLGNLVVIPAFLSLAVREKKA